MKTRLFGIQLSLNGKLTVSHLLCIYLVGLCEKEVSEHIYGVLRNLLAEFNETLRQVRDEVVHQVLPDGLRSRIEEVSLLLLDDLHLGHLSLLLGLSLLLLFGLLSSPFLGLRLPLSLHVLFGAHQPGQLIVLLLLCMSLLSGAAEVMTFSRGRTFFSALCSQLGLVALTLLESPEEGVVSLGDQVEAAGLALGLDEALHRREKLRIAAFEGAHRLEVLSEGRMAVEGLKGLSQETLNALTRLVDI